MAIKDIFLRSFGPFVAVLLLARTAVAVAVVGIFIASSLCILFGFNLLIPYRSFVFIAFSCELRPVIWLVYWP